MNSTGHIATATDNSTWQNYTNVHNMTGYYDKSTPDEQALGGVNRYYDIIAINNNIVTLDRPITHEHIGVGTMAYKISGCLSLCDRVIDMLPSMKFSSSCESISPEPSRSAARNTRYDAHTLMMRTTITVTIVTIILVRVMHILRVFKVTKHMGLYDSF